MTTMLIIRRSLITNCFGKQLKSFFSDRGPIRQKITLIEKEEILGNNKEIFEIFKNFFSSIVAKLNILKYEYLSVNSVNSEDPLENLVIKYKNHLSIRAILDRSLNTSFSLKTVSKKNIEKDILKLNVAKASQIYLYLYLCLLIKNQIFSLIFF